MKLTLYFHDPKTPMKTLYAQPGEVSGIDICFEEGDDDVQCDYIYDKDGPVEEVEHFVQFESNPSDSAPKRKKGDVSDGKKGKGTGLEGYPDVEPPKEGKEFTD